MCNGKEITEINISETGETVTAPNISMATQTEMVIVLWSKVLVGSSLLGDIMWPSSTSY